MPQSATNFTTQEVPNNHNPGAIDNGAGAQIPGIQMLRHHAL